MKTDKNDSSANNFSSPSTYTVTSEEALSFASWGNISAMISQGKGPKPSDIDAVNTVRLAC